jgi:hypothetical protein
VNPKPALATMAEGEGIPAIAKLCFKELKYRIKLTCILR